MGSSRQEGDRHWLVRFCLCEPSDTGGPQDCIACVSVWPETKTGVLSSVLRQGPKVGADGLLGGELWLLASARQKGGDELFSDAVLSLRSLDTLQALLCHTPPHTPRSSALTLASPEGAPEGEP